MTFHNEVIDEDLEHFKTAFHMLKHASKSGKLNHVAFYFSGWVDAVYQMSCFLLKASLATASAHEIIGLRSIHILFCLIVGSQFEETDVDPFAGGFAIAIPHRLAGVDVKIYAWCVNASLLMICFVLM